MYIRKNCEHMEKQLLKPAYLVKTWPGLYKLQFF